MRFFFYSSISFAHWGDDNVGSTQRWLYIIGKLCDRVRRRAFRYEFLKGGIVTVERYQVG